MISPQRIALVTGAASGIGRAAALRLMQLDTIDCVIAADINIEGAKQTIALVEEAGGAGRAEAIDVGKRQSIDAFFDTFESGSEQLVVAHNNAGITGAPMRTHKVEDDVWKKLSSVNMDGVWYCMQRELSIMVRQKQGAIVNTASISGLHGATFAAPYAATKHAVIGMTRSAAAEYGGVGVRVNAVCPGAVDTEMIHAAFGEEGVKALNEKNPMGRLCSVEEVANAVAFLASDQASFVNGHALVVDGGSTIFQ